MKYITDEELWKEAKKSAKNCEKCETIELDLESEGHATKYELCKEHHSKYKEKFKSRSSSSDQGEVDVEFGDEDNKEKTAPKEYFSKVPEKIIDISSNIIKKLSR